MEKIPEIIHESWHQLLQPLFDNPKMEMIKGNLLTRCKFYPAPENIFRVFRMPLDKIKVVILGQDPYFNGSANGLAFAVNSSSLISASLKIIKEEVINSKVERDTLYNIESKEWQELFHWEMQGIFLLNSALTVEIGNAGSHTGQWLWFTREIINIISNRITPIWLLWGAKAKSFKSYISAYRIVDFNKLVTTDLSPNVNYVLEADHPASGTYPGSKYTFMGCNHFNHCNFLLKTKKQTIINW